MRISTPGMVTVNRGENAAVSPPAVRFSPVCCLDKIDIYDDNFKKLVVFFMRGGASSPRFSNGAPAPQLALSLRSGFF